MFVNLKIKKIKTILISCSQITLKEEKKLKSIQISKQTCIERLSFQCASYFQVNWPHCEGTLPLCYGTALEEAASWVVAGVSLCSAPNDTSSSLLKELVATMCSRRAVDFVLCIYTNLMNNYIIKYDFFLKNRQHLSYSEDYPNYSNLQILIRYIP